mmetsp:Transcript_7600/g.11539  ORF Transcript_7600/g.11539 Transcript_7600/m.11539 type:complete len:121 (-) Transcript_7600:179-541(-)
MRFQYIIIGGSVFREGGEAGDDNDVVVVVVVVPVLLLLRGEGGGGATLETELMEVSFSNAVGGGLLWGWFELPHGYNYVVVVVALLYVRGHRYRDQMEIRRLDLKMHDRCLLPRKNREAR